MLPSSPALATDGLAKTYGRGRRRVEALRPLELRVEPGEIFGLLGPNGAGKTTLIKLLLGLVHPTAGAAQLLGRDVRTPEARRRVAFVPEQPRFPAFLMPPEALAMTARLHGLDDPTGRMAEVLERVGLAGREGHRVGTFSKGMHQRLGLASALLVRPAILFLDEPTDGVDPVGRRLVRDVLVDLQAGGTTVFLNSHLLGEVERVCGRVAILKGGRLLRQGRVDDLTRTDRAYTLHTTPIAGPALPEAFGARLQPLPSPAGLPPDLRAYRLLADSRDDLSAALRLLLDAGVAVDAVVPARQRLEDVFLKEVEDTPPSPAA
jgi:ABC-2 type transport system ATP-binding protein